MSKNLTSSPDEKIRNARRSGKSLSIVVWAGLCLALAAGVAGTLAMNQTRRSTPGSDIPAKRSPTLEELDMKAAPFFRQAKANIPAVVDKLTGITNLSKLCWLMASDKVTGSRQTLDYLESVLEEPIIQPCRAAADIYGCDFNSTAFQTQVEAVGIDNAIFSAYAAGGLALELVFLKSTIASLQKVLGAIVARLAMTWSGSAVCVVADGPLPFGDIIAIVASAGGTAWCGYNLWLCQMTLPLELAAMLHDTIQQCQVAFRKAVQP